MKDYSRRLHVAVSGRWYVGLTILIGVISIGSGNNSIYFIESLLLSGLILSGILSEQVIISVDVEIKRSPAIAKDKNQNGDQIVVTNLRNRHLFCIEIGEWIHGQFVPLGWIPYLKPYQVTRINSSRSFSTRGIHHWDAIAIATRYPFGFARKIRFKLQSGQKFVWPAYPQNLESIESFEAQKPLNHGQTPQQGEIRPMLPTDDFRDVIWTLSNQGKDPVVRVRKKDTHSPEVTLDLECQSLNEFEQRVSQAAYRFYQSIDDSNGTLILIRPTGREKIHGRISILNTLALIQSDLRGHS